MTYSLAVFGNPISHSLSPDIHSMFAESANIDIKYQKILVPIGEFSKSADEFFSGGGHGINITVPFKQDAFEFADSLSNDANKAGAVNTIIRQNGKLVGENTDGAGLTRDLTDNLGWRIQDKRVLILGAGGAVQGVIQALLSHNPSKILIANRTFEKAVTLTERFFDSRLDACPLTDLSGKFDLVISASAAGLDDSQSTLDISTDLLTAESCCYDMIYGKQTPFLRWASGLPEAQRSDGLGMLVEQAACSFEHWFGVKVATRSVLEQLRHKL